MGGLLVLIVILALLPGRLLWLSGFALVALIATVWIGGFTWQAQLALGVLAASSIAALALFALRQREDDEEADRAALGTRSTSLSRRYTMARSSSRP